MNSINDRDLFIQWNRNDEPGENPNWISQCGLIEQIVFGDNPTYTGQISPLHDKIVSTSLSGLKSTLESNFRATNELVWEYNEGSIF